MVNLRGFTEQYMIKFTITPENDKITLNDAHLDPLMSS